MELSTRFDPTNNIVIAAAKAEITKENLSIAATKTLELAIEHSCNNLLIDIRKCPPGQSLIDAFWNMQNMQGAMGIDISYRCAVLYDPEIYPDKRANFIEDVVSNRPNPPFKMFKSFEDAIEWLKHAP